MNIGDNLHGFILKDRRPLPETAGDGLYFEHEKSGARLLYLQNEDDNKTFGIGFRTPSANSTGVAHILEHSVLNGSKNYRTKEPFMDLAKSSLATFLNAMTFSDKTIYPVASRNNKDFDNLMGVYLDAVFNPSIYVTPEIFLQEGWHHHLENAEDPITYRGVVYNEMRGALSSADEQVADAVMAALYPDTVYGFESGGDPYEIPELTYDAFLDFHRTYYHPSNAYLYLYGRVDLPRILARIDAEYLSAYERTEIHSALEMQRPFSAPKEISATYSMAADDDPAGKDHLVYGVMFGTRKNLRDIFLADLFTDVLVNSQAAPLRLALQEAGIGADISALSSDGVQIPFCVVAKDTDADRREEFVGIIEETLQRLLTEGLDKDQLLASLNKIEYGHREASGYATRGIIHYIAAFESWLYDENPFDALAYEAPLAQLRADVEAGTLGQEIATRILDNPHKVILTATPDPGKNERKDAAVAEALAAYKASLDEAGIAELIAATERLIARQNRPDTPEERATLPTLALADIDAHLQPIPRESRSVAGADVLLHDLFTSGILYLDLIFDAAHIGADELNDYALLTAALIGAMDTEAYSYSALSTAEYLATGGISLTPTPIRDYHNPNRFFPKLALSTKVIGAENARRFFDLAYEMLFRTDFSDRRRLHEIISMLRSRIEMGIFQQGHRVAANRAASYFSPFAKYGEALSGLDLLFYVQRLDRHFDEEVDALQARLQGLYAKLIARNGLRIGITGHREDALAIEADLAAFIDKLPTAAPAPANYVPDVQPLNEGIQSAAGVQYVARAADLRAHGVAYHGEMEVLSNLLSLEYLYNEIRAKGGAYGQGIRFGKSGSMTIYSYRDPNLSNTFAVYDQLPDWLAALDLDDAQLLPFIIGTMNHFNPAMTAREKGRLDLHMSISGQTLADIEATQNEALNTNSERLRRYAPALRTAMQANIRCALGNAARIKEEAALFDTIIKLEN